MNCDWLWTKGVLVDTDFWAVEHCVAMPFFLQSSRKACTSWSFNWFPWEARTLALPRKWALAYLISEAVDLARYWRRRYLTWLQSLIDAWVIWCFLKLLPSLLKRFICCPHCRNVQNIWSHLLAYREPESSSRGEGFLSFILLKWNGNSYSV